MRTVAVLLVLGSIAACKSKSDSSPPPAKDPPPDKPVAAKDAIHEIAAQPRSAVTAKTGFLELMIDVPASASAPSKGDKVASFVFKDSKLDLQITEHSEQPSGWNPKGGPAPNIDSKVTRTTKDEAGAYVVVDRKDDATSFRVEYCRDLDQAEPPSGICCNVRLTSETALVDIDKLIAFGEEMCRSIKVTNRKLPAAGSAAGSGSASGSAGSAK
jgi:hypothetical protein